MYTGMPLIDITYIYREALLYTLIAFLSLINMFKGTQEYYK